jgi:hypothetical protein
LPAAGREVLSAYRALEAKLAEAAKGSSLDTLQARLRAEPRASQHA